VSIEVGAWNLPSVFVASFMATVLAYVVDPRWKAVISTLPLPSTMLFLAVGLPISLNNALGLLLLLFFFPFVHLLYRRWSVPIVLAITVAAVTYDSPPVLWTGD